MQGFRYLHIISRVRQKPASLCAITACGFLAVLRNSSHVAAIRVLFIATASLDYCMAGTVSVHLEGTTLDVRCWV